MTSVPPVRAPYYPESDGRPMGETDVHRNEMVRLIELLTDYYQGQDVYVSGDLLVYFEQGNAKKFVVPDVFTVKGVSPLTRRIYKVWVEGKVPDVIIEVTSRKTRRKDTGTKPSLYLQLGIREYFLFDVLGEYLDPPLQGYRLVDESYRAIEPDADGRLVSQELELRLAIGENVLDLYRLDTGERLLTRLEQAERSRAEAERHAAIAAQAIARAELEARARAAAEAEIVRLREEMERREN